MTAWNGIEPWPGNPVLDAWNWKRKGETVTDALPNDMEIAARTLELASERLGADRPKDPAYQSWRPVDLRMKAAEWRVKDEERQKIYNELLNIVGHSRVSAVKAILEYFDVTPKPDRIVGGSPVMTMGPGPWEPDAGGSGAHDYSEGPPSTW